MRRCDYDWEEHIIICRIWCVSSHVEGTRIHKMIINRLKAKWAVKTNRRHQMRIEIETWYLKLGIKIFVDREKLLTCKPSSIKCAWGSLSLIFCSALMVKTAVVSKRIALTTHILAMIPYRPQFDDCISCIFKLYFLLIFFNFSALCFLINTKIYFVAFNFIASVLICRFVYSFVHRFMYTMSFHPTDYTYSALFLELLFRFGSLRNSIQSRLSFYFLRWQKQLGKE